MKQSPILCVKFRYRFSITNVATIVNTTSSVAENIYIVRNIFLYTVLERIAKIIVLRKYAM